jgi:hypothetical protein
MLNAEKTRDGCSDTAIWPPDIVPKKISMMKLLLAFVLAGFLLLCGAYSILAYYRLVSIAKGIGPYGWIRSRNFF